ncbi:MAG: MFS transporter [Anaerolineales bacterium]|nr:MFS transporter [Anaerolineales bacterium]
MTSATHVPSPTAVPLPGRIQFFYAIGQLGWSTLINIVGLQLLFFYIPPENAGIPFFITQAVFFVVLNAITLIAAAGRLLDAITDPLIGSFSDRLQHKDGRRIPFMRWGALPAGLFCILMFVPIVSGISTWNILWLLLVQACFYVTLTMYVTPYFALLPEMGKTATERLNLSTWISITYALGIVAAAIVPALAGPLGSALGLATPQAIQLAIAILATLAVLCMYVPVLTIDEHKYTDSKPSNEPLLPALRATLSNQNFRFYVVADFVYFMGLAIIQTGLLFYITVLLGLDEGLVLILLGLTVVLSFVAYPVVNLVARRVGKKGLIVFAFFAMSVIFLSIFFFGQSPLPNTAEAYLFAIFYALPLAILGVLPNAVLADIAGHDALQTGQPKEGMYFAARTLLQKMGQTTGIMLFAMLTTFGKDPGDDFGIRLSGLFGCLLCFAAGFVFLRYREKQLLAEIDAMTA